MPRTFFHLSSDPLAVSMSIDVIQYKDAYFLRTFLARNTAMNVVRNNNMNVNGRFTSELGIIIKRICGSMAVSVARRWSIVVYVEKCEQISNDVPTRSVVRHYRTFERTLCLSLRYHVKSNLTVCFFIAKAQHLIPSHVRLFNFETYQCNLKIW